VTGPGGLPEVDVREAERRQREDPARPLLVDVREPSEFAEVRAPDAALLPTSTFLSRIDELPTDRPLLFICRTGSRSAAVTAYMLRSGRSDVANVAGGMEAWQAAGLPVRSGPPGPDEGRVPG
jgi:rhodanese-related sulfurtransferase